MRPRLPSLLSPSFAFVALLRASKTSTSASEPSAEPAHVSSAASASERLPKTKAKKGHRRGKNSSRPRGGKALREAGGDSYAADTRRLQKKLVSRGDLYQTTSYSVERDGSRVSTGWQGRNPPPRARSEIRRLYGSKEMQTILESFFPVYANL